MTPYLSLLTLVGLIASTVHLSVSNCSELQNKTLLVQNNPVQNCKFAIQCYTMFWINHGQALLLDNSYVVKKFLRSVQHEAGNLGPKLQPSGGFFGP